MILNYNKYIQLIKEGLIKTHNILQYSNTLQNNLQGIGFDTNIIVKDKYEFSIRIFNPEHFLNKDYFEMFFKYTNNIGYFPTSFNVFKNERYNFFTFSEDKLSEQIQLKITEIEIFFESKYDDSLYKNDIETPNVAFHLSPSKNKKSIMKSGFYPKAGMRKSYHLDRIYMFYDIENYKNLLKELKLNDNIKDLDYEYDLYKIYLNENILIHQDPNYLLGFYTYDNIHPNKIELIKKNL